MLVKENKVIQKKIVCITLKKEIIDVGLSIIFTIKWPIYIHDQLILAFCFYLVINN
jgi:hypothetical protein